MLSIPNISQTAYRQEADKLADLENRAAAFEREESDAINALAALGAPEPNIDAMDVDELMKPAAPIATIATRDLVDIRRDLARVMKAIELQRPIAAKAKAVATKAAIAIATESVKLIVSQTTTKMKEAIAIAEKADDVLAAIEEAGYDIETIDENVGLFRESHLLMHGFCARIAVVKDVDKMWIHRMAELDKPVAAGSMFLRFCGSIAGHSFSAQPGDIFEWLDKVEGRRLVERGIAEELSYAAAVCLANQTGCVIKKPRVETVPAPAPGGIMASVKAAAKTAKDFVWAP